MKRFAVVLVEMRSGERMPLLVDSTTGIGVFDATVYALKMGYAAVLCCTQQSPGPSRR